MHTIGHLLYIIIIIMFNLSLIQSTIKRASFYFCPVFEVGDGRSNNEIMTDIDVQTLGGSKRCSSNVFTKGRFKDDLKSIFHHSGNPIMLGPPVVPDP